MSRPDTAALATGFAARFLLRLDNGALLGDSSTLGDQSASGPILLPVEQAFALGRLGPQHVSSLETKLQKVHSSVPGARPLASVSGRHGLHQSEVLLSVMASRFLVAAGSWSPVVSPWPSASLSRAASL